MFLKKNRLHLHSFSLRLTAWYTCMFALGIIIYSFLALVSMTMSIQKHDRHHIVELLDSYQETTNSEPEKIKYRFEASSVWTGQQDFLVMLFSREGNPLFVTLPKGWSRKDISHIEQTVLDLPAETWQMVKRENSSVSSGAIIKFLFMSDPDQVQFRYRKLNENFFLVVGRTQKKQFEKIERFYKASKFILLPLILMSFFFGHILTRKSLKPVKRLIRTIQQVRNGSVETRVKVSSTGDEFEDLAKIFNNMLDQVEIVISEMRDALDNLAHDIRTPLTRMRGTVEAVLQKGASREELHEALQDCAEESERITSIITTLLDISELESGVKNLDFEKQDLSLLVSELVDMYQMVAEDKNIELQAELQSTVLVSVDVDYLRQGIANIIDNGITYTKGDGEIFVSIHVQGEEAVLSIKDTGIGIDSNVLPNVFNRLYRGPQDTRQQGVGLGLSFSRAVVAAHQGNISVSSVQGQGTEFKIVLPLLK